MRKILSIFAAMLVAVAVNATILDIAPESPQSSDNIRREIRDHINAGDTLRLADGVYTEKEVVELSKSVVIMAAQGANPVIKQQYYMKLLGENTVVTFIGIKFDASLYPASDHCIRAYDELAGKKLILENCEFVGWPSYILYAQRANRCIDELVIKNCYFHDNKRCAVYLGAEDGKSCNKVRIEGSTFANFTELQNPVIYVNNGGTEQADIEVRVDHCTFYNYMKTSANTYTAIDSRKSTDVVISNCIFAQPSAQEYGSTYCYGGTINNCLSYNTTGHRSSGVNLADNIEGDPLFIDAANGDLRLALNSPARKAGSDGKTLGDPRWWPVYEVSTHSIDFGDVEKGSGSAMESFYLKGADLTANVRIYDFTIPYGAIFSHYPAAVTPMETEYPNGKKVEVYAAKYVDAGEYKGYLVLESKDFPNDTIKLRVNIVEPAPTHTYTVAGSSDVAFGTAWAPTNTDNDMFLQEDNTYKWEKTDLTLPTGNIEFKVCVDHSFDVAYPNQNYVLEIKEAGIYTITIYYNPNDNNYVGAVATKTGDAVVIPTVAMHGNFLGESWADTENFTLAGDEKTASLTLTLAAGNYEFGMRIGGSGNWTANGVAFTRENNAAVVVAGQGNLTLAADAAGEYTFTWTYESNTLAITFPNATAIDNVNVAGKTMKKIENGQMIIIKNGIKYNAIGTVVK